MSALEEEILRRVRSLAPENQRQALDFLEQPEHGRPLSARELMRLPAEERQRRVRAAITSAADEDFETFEAYSQRGGW